MELQNVIGELSNFLRSWKRTYMIFWIPNDCFRVPENFGAAEKIMVWQRTFVVLKIFTTKIVLKVKYFFRA